MNLDELRRQIDRVDEHILQLLSDRNTLIDKVAEYKRLNHLEAKQPQRYQEMLKLRIKKARELGVDEETVRSIWVAIHDASVLRQENRS